MTEPTETILSVAGITKSFGAVRACNSVSLDLVRGEIHALIGPNGAGKSTLIKQIAGGLRPDAGTVSFLGRDVTRLGTVARARMGLARTFQISSLIMADTVLQNVMLGALGASGARTTSGARTKSGARGGVFRFFNAVIQDKALREVAEHALTRVGLHDLATARTSELSHGQRRQLEVAVALTLSPKAFIMDEPMAGLGSDGSKSLTELLSGLRAEAPILLVEHDMDAVFALADRISVLVDGAIIATGTRDDIRAHPQVRRAYLGEDA